MVTRSAVGLTPYGEHRPRPALRETSLVSLAGIEMAEALRLDTGNGRRLDGIERELEKLRDGERRLV